MYSQMKQVFLFLFIFFIISNFSETFSQTSKFRDVTDKMFLNILKHEPHDLVYPFINKYYPQFTVKRDSSGWTMYPDIEIPENYPVVNSFQFSRHPFFDVIFQEGQLDILSRNAIDGKPWSIRDFRLWFVFDNKADGQTAFNKLSEMFDPISKTKKIFEKGGRKVAQYSDHNEIEIVGTIEFILTEDELYPEKSKLFFRSGAMTYSE